MNKRNAIFVFLFFFLSLSCLSFVNANIFGDMRDWFGSITGNTIRDNPSCIDSDRPLLSLEKPAIGEIVGIEAFRSGIVTHHGREYYDVCRSDTILKEFSCKGNSIKRENINCPGRCQYGKCVLLSEFKDGTTEQDGGNDVYSFGYVSKNLWVKNKDYHDQCSGDKLTEVYVEERGGRERVKRARVDCEFGCENGRCIEKYHFKYPEDKKSGYYAVPRGNCKDHCNECTLIDPLEECLEGSNTFYQINEGYEEDFEYLADFPIYGSWEIRDIDIGNFNEKCFVGDCSLANNKRKILCIDENYLPKYILQEDLDKDSLMEYNSTLSCDKWRNPTELYLADSAFCLEGRYNFFSDSGRIWTGGDCFKPTVVNFYYIYNEFEGNEGYFPFEGYSSDWKDRWEKHFIFLRKKMEDYNISLSANYYEYKLEDNSDIPGVLVNFIPYSELNEGIALGIYSPSDVNVFILAGKMSPFDYGVNCIENNSLSENCFANPLSAYAFLGGSTIRIPDYYSTAQDDGDHTLLHEFGHVQYCFHTIHPSSLGPHLYANDVMSYGTINSKQEFFYSCKIKLDILGRQQTNPMVDPTKTFKRGVERFYYKEPLEENLILE